MNKALALIVDDEPDIRELLELTLDRMGIQTHSAENIEDAKALLQQKSFDLCLTDMRLPDDSGLYLVEYVQKLPNPLPVAVTAAHGSMDTAILSDEKRRI